MPMLADLVDAVVGVDTHCDTHEVEIALPTGRSIATTSISNDTTGYAQLLAWILDHAPGPRMAIAIEGTRSYGIGLARAAAAAGLIVLESEQPTRTARRGRGKFDPIDAHLAVLAALRLDTDRLPTPRADGDREALRILLGARQELTTTNITQIKPAAGVAARRRRHRPPGGPRRSHHRQPHPAGPSPTAARRHHGTGRAPRRDPQTHPRRP